MKAHTFLKRAAFGTVLGAGIALASAAFADDPGFPAPTGDPSILPEGSKLERIFDGGCVLTAGVGEVDQLQPTRLAEACAAKGVSLNLRMQEGYDHSYFFISTFIDDHINFHADALAK